jgi:hypothetical protein
MGVNPASVVERFIVKSMIARVGVKQTTTSATPHVVDWKRGMTRSS